MDSKYQIVQERDTNNNPLVSYTRGLDLSGSLKGASGIGGLLARSDGNGATYYHADANGNITSLMDGNENIVGRYLYNPFGKPLGQWGSLAGINEMQFSSMPQKDGLTLYAFRGYEPNFQRWLNQDPGQESGGINLYGFVSNESLNYIDPTGSSLTSLDTPTGMAVMAWLANLEAQSLDKAYTGCSGVGNGEIQSPVQAAIDEAGFIPIGGPFTFGEKVVAEESLEGLSSGLRYLSERHITESGETVLGMTRPPPGYLSYIEKAEQSGASYFYIGDVWGELTPAEQEAANFNFLDVIGSRGDTVLLSVPKSEIIPGSALDAEIKYLQNSLNYRWVNQWSLQPR